jgi:hypothetical protein
MLSLGPEEVALNQSKQIIFIFIYIRYFSLIPEFSRIKEFLTIHGCSPLEFFD